MRARQPDVVGAVERGGVRVGYEVFEALEAEGRPALVLLTSWAIVHMRQWKLQVPALARRFRLVTVEGRGNGAADRPRTEAAYADHELVADAVAVMDAVGFDRAVVIGLSMGGRHALQLAAAHPDPGVAGGPPTRKRRLATPRDYRLRAQPRRYWSTLPLDRSRAVRKGEQR